MKIETKEEILGILNMPEAEFRAEVMPAAVAAYEAVHGKHIYAAAMLGYSNICKNQCLYCGMRAENKIPRYRISPEDVMQTAELAHKAGFSRMFLVSGEDMGYGFENLLHVMAFIHGLGMRVSLAAGEFTMEQYRELAAAGVDEYVVKFEMSDRLTFDRLNPSTSFERRMKSIEAVQKSGMHLASGNIVGYPGQTLNQVADDIFLMKKLSISWAPVIPYMPVPGTPLSQEGGRGDRILNLKEIAILRLMMPQIDITAQQPGDNLKNGLADEQGNLDAVNAGANLLFCDFLSEAQAGDFRVIDNRNIRGTEHLYRVAKLSGMELEL